MLHDDDDDKIYSTYMKTSVKRQKKTRNLEKPHK